MKTVKRSSGRAPGGKKETDRTAPILYPLNRFCGLQKRPLPAACSLVSAAVPAPYDRLLVHTADMTTKLKEYHGGETEVRILHQSQSDDGARQCDEPVSDDGPFADACLFVSRECGPGTRQKHDRRRSPDCDRLSTPISEVHSCCLLHLKVEKVRGYCGPISTRSSKTPGGLRHK